LLLSNDSCWFWYHGSKSYKRYCCYVIRTNKPAPVAIARTFTDKFTGINYLNTPFFIIAELLGALLAIFVIKKMLFTK